LPQFSIDSTTSKNLKAAGGEKVREVLETIMGGIIHIVDEHGGDVLR
jgi:hypothetical protein